MAKFLLDTNVCIQIGKQASLIDTLIAGRDKKGMAFVLPPITIIELFRGFIIRGQAGFERNQTIFRRLRKLAFEIVDLSEPFVWKLLWGTTFDSPRVQPLHYEQLISMLMNSSSFEDFIEKSQKRDSVWKQIDEADEIHEKVVDKEIPALRTLANKGKHLNLAHAISKKYVVGGLLPDPEYVLWKFSAALEYLESWIEKVRIGAKPEKNERGLYGDLQLFWYLGDPENNLISMEDFAVEIRNSPQRKQILTIAQLTSIISA